MSTREVWRYYVHEGQVFCPRHLEQIDVATCATCDELRAVEDEDGDPSIVCIPPPGDTAASRLRAFLR